jgi:hypothetical protein
MHPGDSGSVVIIFLKYEMEATIIEKCLVVGMVYSMLLEDPPMPFLAFFYLMKDLILLFIARFSLSQIFQESIL